MFAGIVEESAEVVGLDRSKQPFKLTLRSALDHSTTGLGDSIAVDGVCLTVVSNASGLLAFDVSDETLRRSTLGTLKTGDRVNLERSLMLGDRIHGHLVSGHVDATVKLLSRHDDGKCEKYVWELPASLRPFIATKGSVSLSGISLTVGELTDNSFCVYIVPHTSQVTTLARMQPGMQINVEVDMLARYVNTALTARGSGGLDREFLERCGYVEK
jgi:riboflavin synthase